MSGKSYIIDSLKNSSLSTLQVTIRLGYNCKSEVEVIINKLRCYVQINSVAELNFK